MEAGFYFSQLSYLRLNIKFEVTFFPKNRLPGKAKSDSESGALFHDFSDKWGMDCGAFVRVAHQ